MYDIEKLNRLMLLKQNCDWSPDELQPFAEVHRTAGSYMVLTKGDRFFISTPDGIYEMLKTYESNWNTPVMKFDYTPDNLHTYRVEVRETADDGWVIVGVDVIELPHHSDFIKPGMECELDGISLKFISEEWVEITLVKEDRIKRVPVKEDGEFVYSIQKRRIIARDGAYGLFAFMDQIAEQCSKTLFPFGEVHFRKLKSVFDLSPVVLHDN